MVESPTANRLAVVIPAFKRRFLAEALDSLACQTDPRFHVYVCDDGSPEPLRDLAEAALPPERLTYRRFEPNQGARHVVRHWNRSVRSTTEPWVWLFSDDDVMEPRCVETFLATVEACPSAYDVFRFNSLTIDAEGRVTRINPPHPPRETPVEFAYHRLMDQRASFAPDYIFRRTTFERSGGLVEMPFGVGSDDASWITFAGEGEIHTLPGPRVRWRLSGVNISAGASEFVEKEKAYLEYVVWLAQRFEGVSPLLREETMAFTMPEMAERWFRRHLHTHGSSFSWRALHEIPFLARSRLGANISRLVLIMLYANARGAMLWLKRLLTIR